MHYVRLDCKGRVDFIIKLTSSSTGDVCSGNREPINSRHTEGCHLRYYSYMCHGTCDVWSAFLTTLPEVLADSLLHCFLPRDGRDLVQIQQYIPESVQSWDASKQLLQGEKQQKFYLPKKFIGFCALSLSNSYCYFTVFLGNYFI